MLVEGGRAGDGLALFEHLTAERPDNAWRRFFHGFVLLSQGRDKEAEAALREALRLKPDYPQAHTNLGVALERQGRNKEAEAEHREAIRLKPDYPLAHSNLGSALAEQGQYKEAEAAFREALRLRPDFPLAHCNPGHALCEQGRFADALESLRRGHTLGSKLPGWRNPSADWVRECERLVELDRKLPAILRGDAEPASAVERIELAILCQRYKRLHVAATRLYGDAFTDDPKLAGDLKIYHAARSAALAAAGQGEDAKRLPDKVALMLRRQALRWLQGNMALYAKLAKRDDPEVKEALDKLPEDERKEWRQFWDDVAALLKKVQDTK